MAFISLNVRDNSLLKPSGTGLFFVGTFYTTFLLSKIDELTMISHINIYIYTHTYLNQRTFLTMNNFVFNYETFAEGNLLFLPRT